MDQELAERQLDVIKVGGVLFSDCVGMVDHSNEQSAMLLLHFDELIIHMTI
jgi:hypothetical protein